MIRARPLTTVPKPIASVEQRASSRDRYLILPPVSNDGG
jgi:hypothetical protein